MSTLITNYASVTDTTALTITLASLASSSSWLTGQASTVVDNTSNKYVGAKVSGQIRTGTSPTAGGQILIYAWEVLKIASSTASFPIATTTAFTGTDAAATFELEQKTVLKLAQAITVNGTTGRDYGFNFALEPLFGGWMPLKWGLFVTHSTGVNLDSTAGNHWIHFTGTKLDF
jgi:hypothetical protein